MTPQSPNSRDNSVDRGRGKRAEDVANWYFRLNGFLQIPSFVLHADESRRTITDADLLGVRFPYSQESMRGIQMTDDRWLSKITMPGQVLFVISEVKVSTCGVNGPWTNREAGGMEKVIRRIGFAPDDMTPQIADQMYNQLHWFNDDFRVQYVSVGKQANHELKQRYKHLHQLTWEEVAIFMYERFDSFGTLKGSHQQWKPFGNQYSSKFLRGKIPDCKVSVEFIHTYIEKGIRGLQEHYR